MFFLQTYPLLLSFFTSLSAAFPPSSGYSLSARGLNISVDTVAVSNAVGPPRLDLTGLYMSGQCTFPNGTLKASSNMWIGFGLQAPHSRSKRARFQHGSRAERKDQKSRISDAPSTRKPKAVAFRSESTFIPVTPDQASPLQPRASAPIASSKGKFCSGGNRDVKLYLPGPSMDRAGNFQPRTIGGGLPLYTSSASNGPNLYYNYLLWNTYWSDKTNTAQSPPGTANIPVEAAATNASVAQITCNAIAQFPFSGGIQDANSQSLVLPGGRYFTLAFVSSQPLGDVILWGYSLGQERAGKAKAQKLGVNNFGGQKQGMWTFAAAEDFKSHFEFKFGAGGGDGVVLLLDTGLACPTSGC